MFNGIVFSGVQFGIAIMRFGARDDDAPRGPRQAEAVLVPVAARPARRRP